MKKTSFVLFVIFFIISKNVGSQTLDDILGKDLYFEISIEKKEEFYDKAIKGVCNWVCNLNSV